MPDTVTSTIEKFYSVAQERDFSRDINFRLLSLSLGDGSSVTFDENDLVYAKGATLPARNIVNQAVPFLGLQFNVPGTATYQGSDSYPLTFFADMNSIIRDKLEEASREIYDDATSTGNYFMPKASATMDLVQINPKLEVVKHYTLIGVSVRNINNITYNYQAGTGAPMEISTTIAFHYYTTK